MVVVEVVEVVEVFVVVVVVNNDEAKMIRRKRINDFIQ